LLSIDRHIPKLNVAGSIPVSRSNHQLVRTPEAARLYLWIGRCEPLTFLGHFDDQKRDGFVAGYE
jgi:hypothetical protein